MKRISLLCACLLSGTALALTTQSFNENTDVAVLLSDANYNRLVVKGDKITQAHFPEGSMAIKNEEDGSLYVLVAQKEPFTLFLTTESGHHFSTTVNTETSLGKTIEFVSTVKTQTAVLKPVIKPQQAPMADAISVLMTHMIKNDRIKGFELKHHYGRVVRLQQGLMLTPKLTYTGITLNGEVTEIYNGGKMPLDLTENLFMGDDVKAVSLSQATLAPKQKAYVYRVLERSHG
jgi:conjugal transfer pilus assembly protein TraK